MLPDHLRAGLDVVFCGTAVGRMSAAWGHYYANSGNLFWRVLAETGLTPQRLRPEDDWRMPHFGLGLTDLAKGVAGQDADIPRAAFDPDRVFATVAALRPRALAFTSLTAARIACGAQAVAGPLPPDPRAPGVQLWALPSPSGLARRHFDRGPWQALADWRGARAWAA